MHSQNAGIFQPSMTEAVRLLSRQPFVSNINTKPDLSVRSPDISDPFSSPHLTYSTNGTDTFPAPSAYPSRKYSWVHIFPEGFVHQHPRKTMRYFKWGVARLILEPDVCPDIIPMWIEGTQEVMHESRTWPRFVPRAGKDIGIWFGDNVGGDGSGPFHELRQRWQDLVKTDMETEGNERGGRLEIGVVNEGMKYGQEAEELRKECTMQIRQEVLKVRRLRGLPDEDPKEGLVETWRKEGGGRGEGKMEDGSWVKEM